MPIRVLCCPVLSAAKLDFSVQHIVSPTGRPSRRWSEDNFIEGPSSTFSAVDGAAAAKYQRPTHNKPNRPTAPTDGDFDSLGRPFLISSVNGSDGRDGDDHNSTPNFLLHSTTPPPPTSPVLPRSLRLPLIHHRSSARNVFIWFLLEIGSPTRDVLYIFAVHCQEIIDFSGSSIRRWPSTTSEHPQKVAISSFFFGGQFFAGRYPGLKCGSTVVALSQKGPFVWIKDSCMVNIFV